MKLAFYPRLAFRGIYNNRKTYLPYLLTSSCMVMMFYLLAFLSENSTISRMRGGDDLQSILSLGTFVIAFFALIFLFYTNSFLMRRRKAEFGLYNILGMGKRHLARILIWETLIILAISLLGGLLCGILFSKLSEMVILRLLDGTPTFTFTVASGALWKSLFLFAGIFTLTLLNALRQIHVARPIELLRSENLGEKPPRANWVLAAIGVLLLGGAYTMAVRIENPLAAMIYYFVAVLMVIAATYLLFVAGSVTLCRTLQKNKRYYYKTNHFVSLSSMSFRMKRNGAGLATICILSTIVLVMISTTMCLYFGEEDILKNRFPRDLSVETYSLEQEETDKVRAAVLTALEQHGGTAENLVEYRFLSVAARQSGHELLFDNQMDGLDSRIYDSVWQLYIIPLDDYNRCMNTAFTLAKNEVLLCTSKTDYTEPTLRIAGTDFTVKAHLEKALSDGTDTMQVLSSLYLVVPEADTLTMISHAQEEAYGNDASAPRTYLGTDFQLSGDEEAMLDDLQRALSLLTTDNSEEDAGDEFLYTRLSSATKARATFFGAYGGLFFLGLMLGFVFLLSAVLIMYYKQITEGYEDRSRFTILQKVGMTHAEVKKSINSQVLTVFFLPLLTAGVHVAFSFPMISRMLLVFGMSNTGLLAGITVGCYLVFALFYVLVYRATSHTYYNLVSKPEN